MKYMAFAYQFFLNMPAILFHILMYHSLENTCESLRACCMSMNAIGNNMAVAIHMPIHVSTAPVRASFSPVIDII